MLELAVLGLLLESPMHGYELRKRLTGLLGACRAFSYGSLYPALRRMQADGLIESRRGSGSFVRQRPAERQIQHLRGIFLRKFFDNNQHQNIAFVLGEMRKSGEDR